MSNPDKNLTAAAGKAPAGAGPAAGGRRASSSSSVGRVFDVLDLFTLERPELRIEDVSELLQYTRSTTYRYLKALCDAGLVAPVGGGYYGLGPRAIELDRQLQLTDPLLQGGRLVMPALAAESPNSALLLCTMYREKVLCIHNEGPTALQHRGQPVTISRPRGLSLPLFTGAASLAILANLPAYRMKSLYLRHREAIDQAGLGGSWESFRARLAELRRDGYAFSTNNINTALAGVAVPIFHPEDGSITGSLTQVRSRDDFSADAVRAAVDRLAGAAGRIAVSLHGGEAR